MNYSDCTNTKITKAMQTAMTDDNDKNKTEFKIIP
jgi:hypothetical protein